MKTKFVIVQHYKDDDREVHPLKWMPIKDSPSINEFDDYKSAQSLLDKYLGLLHITESFNYLRENTFTIERKRVL